MDVPQNGSKPSRSLNEHEATPSARRGEEALPELDAGASQSASSEEDEDRSPTEEAIEIRLEQRRGGGEEALERRRRLKLKEFDFIPISVIYVSVRDVDRVSLLWGPGAHTP